MVETCNSKVVVESALVVEVSRSSTVEEETSLVVGETCNGSKVEEETFLVVEGIHMWVRSWWLQRWL